MNDYFWQGSWIGEDEVTRRLESLPSLTEKAMAAPLDPSMVVAACERLAQSLSVAKEPELREISAFLGQDALERKLRRELGSPWPARLTRPDPRSTVYETWAPVGLLAHITPGNSLGVPALSAVEGLLTGNLNIVKTTASGGLLAHELLGELASFDPSIAERLIVLRFPSSRDDWLRRICEASDAVAVWGGEDAVASVSELVPPGCRLIAWGHKISFAYLTSDFWTDGATLDGLVHDLYELDQQACSSPQVVYLDTGSFAEVKAFTARFAAALEKSGRQAREPDAAEQAELTAVELVTRLEEHLDLTSVTSGPGYRLLADSRPALAASPLFQTVWIKPLPRDRMIATLRPMRRYLQTAGIACARTDLAELSRLAFAAGVERVTPVGDMTGGYTGEPHDGVYALQRYSRRVSVRASDAFAGDACLDDLLSVPLAAPPDGPVLGKAEVQQLNEALAPEHAELYVRSGGTTGAPALSLFTYDDYDTQMQAAAEGLVAAGFDPATDRAANLFYAGEMYGGFISFFSVLERLRAVQIPMAGSTDLGMVAEALVDYKVDTVLGMPSYLWRLFTDQEQVLRAYGGIRKIFYGGEHFGRAQRDRLQQDFGVRLIRSGAYGSNDIGPLAYQCTHATGTEHHLQARLHTLEILNLETDAPAPPGEPGRLIFTSLVRRGQRSRRYDLGDLGRWIPAPCPCGRRTPRFELLGRTGDVVRTATFHFHHKWFTTTIDEALSYAGDLQLVIDRNETSETMTVLIDAASALNPSTVRRMFLDHNADLRSAVQEGLLSFDIRPVPSADFTRSPQSGKLRPIIDDRPR